MTKKELNEKIKENLRFLIDNSSLTDEEIESAIELPNGTFANFFSKTTYQMPIIQLVVIADYFAVPLDFITGRCTKDQAEYIMDNYLYCYNQLCRTSYEKYLSGKRYRKITFEVQPQWPYNLLEDIFQKSWKYPISDEQEVGLIKSLKTLSGNDLLLLTSYYRDGSTFAKIARENEICLESARQRIKRIVRKLQNPLCMNDIKYGPSTKFSKYNSQIEYFEAQLDKKYSDLKEYEKELNRHEMDIMMHEYDVKLLEERVCRRKSNISQIINNRSLPDDPNKLLIQDIKFSFSTYEIIRRPRDWRYKQTDNELVFCKTLQDLINLVRDGKLKYISGINIINAREILETIYTLTGKKYTYNGVDVTKLYKDTNDEWYGSWSVL